MKDLGLGSTPRQEANNMDFYSRQKELDEINQEILDLELFTLEYKHKTNNKYKKEHQKLMQILHWPSSSIYKDGCDWSSILGFIFLIICMILSLSPIYFCD